MAREYLIEILEMANKDPNILEEHKGNVALKMLFEYAFLPENKFILPEGIPPFKEDGAALGMTPSNFTMEMRRLYIFTEKQQLSATRRESLFIELLEGLHPSEAKVLCHIKDQTLPKLYKKLTASVVAKYGFLPMPEVEETTEVEEGIVEEPKKKRGRGRPKKNADPS